MSKLKVHLGTTSGFQKPLMVPICESYSIKHNPLVFAKTMSEITCKMCLREFPNRANRS